ncbi:MAG: phosphatase PAP2 family protein [Candidatus Krumholzibacteria bacterium]|nr:phosphatase PAP2 family protein [Candidatus Krumholzibacteria bacterium]
MNFRILIFIPAVLVMMTFFPIFASAAETDDITAPDLGAFRLLNGKAANPFFDFLMPIVTDFRKWRIVLVIVWVALVIFGKAKGRWAAFMMIPLVAASDQLCASLIKPLVGRMRPCEVLGNVHFWHGVEGWITTPAEVVRSYKSSFSFPSNHAANMTGAMVFLGLVYRKSLIYLLIVAFAVSYSRIYIGVHWPLDVLAGMAIGTTLAFLAWTAFKWIYHPARKKQAKTPGER